MNEGYCWKLQPRPKGAPEPELISADWNQDSGLPRRSPVLCLALPWLSRCSPRRSVTCPIQAASLPFLDENGNEAQIEVYVMYIHTHLESTEHEFFHSETKWDLRKTEV